MTDTKGNGMINTLFDDYGPYKGDIQYRKQGSLIAYESGEAITYGLFNAQERGTLFINPVKKFIPVWLSARMVKPRILKLMYVRENSLPIPAPPALMKP